MGEFDVTIEEVEAALARLQETPLRGEKEPFWRDQQKRMLRNLLEMLKDTDFSARDSKRKVKPYDQRI